MTLAQAHLVNLLIGCVAIVPWVLLAATGDWTWLVIALAAIAGQFCWLFYIAKRWEP